VDERRTSVELGDERRGVTFALGIAKAAVRREIGAVDK